MYTGNEKNIPHESVLKELGIFRIIKQRLSRNIIVIYKYARKVNFSDRHVLIKDNGFT